LLPVGLPFAAFIAIFTAMAIVRERERALGIQGKSLLSAAYQAGGQLDRAVAAEEEALRAWPDLWAGWGTDQLAFYPPGGTVLSETPAPPPRGGGAQPRRQGAMANGGRPV